MITLTRTLTNATVCLTRGCYGGGKITRGLCKSCYNKLNHIVRLGLDTWDALERRGFALPISKLPNGGRYIRLRNAIFELHESGISPTPGAIRHKMKRRLPLSNGEHFMRREILIEIGIDDGDGPNIFFQPPGAVT